MPGLNTLPYKTAKAGIKFMERNIHVPVSNRKLYEFFLTLSIYLQFDEHFYIFLTPCSLEKRTSSLLFFF